MTLLHLGHCSTDWHLNTRTWSSRTLTVHSRLLKEVLIRILGREPQIPNGLQVWSVSHYLLPALLPPPLNSSSQNVGLGSRLFFLIRHPKMIANETVNSFSNGFTYGINRQSLKNFSFVLETGREKIDPDMSLFCRSHFHSGFLSS